MYVPHLDAWNTFQPNFVRMFLVVQKNFYMQKSNVQATKIDVECKVIGVESLILTFNIPFKLWISPWEWGWK